MIGRRRRWRLDVWFARAALEPCILIAQLLNLQTESGVLGRELLDDIQQLPNDLAGCGLGDGVEVDLRKLHTQGVYQTSVLLSLAVPAVMERILPNR